MHRKNIILPLSILFILSAIFGMFLTSVFRDNLTEKLVNQINKQQLTAITQTEEILKTRITNLKERLELIAEIPQIASGDSQSCNQKLTEVFEIMQSKVDNMTRINAQGTIICAVDQKIMGTSGLEDRPHVRQIFQDPKHQPVLSDVFTTPGSSTNAISVVIPIFSGGQFSGTLGGTIYLDELDEKYLDDITLSSLGSPLILDTKGNFIHHPQKEFIGKNFWSEEVQKQFDKNESLAGVVKNNGKEQSGTLTFNFNREPQVASYVSKDVFPNSHWLIISTTSVDGIRDTLIDTDINSIFFAITILIGLTMFIIPILYWFFIIKSIAQTKKEIQQESLSEPEDTAAGQTGFYKTIMDLKKLRDIVARQEIEIDKLKRNKS